MSLYKTDPELLETYDKIFKEQLSLGIIEQIDTPNSKPGQVLSLPHHPVLRFDKETTKVCAVFDASAKVNGNPSLNDYLQKGPQLTPLICWVLGLSSPRPPSPGPQKVFNQLNLLLLKVHSLSWFMGLWVI